MNKIARLGVIAAIILCAFMSVAGVALAKSVEEIAWQRAVKLAKVTKSEEAAWPKPTITIYQKPRFMPFGDGTDGFRLCGQFLPYLEGTREEGLTMVYRIEVYARATGEEQLVLDGLTHELLHFVYLQRAISDPSWEKTQPDTETWVRALVPAECPNK